jgi:hypothetical protein
MLTKNLAPGDLKYSGLNSIQLFFILGGYFGFVEGLQVGQTHAITLLLVSIAVIASIRKKPFIAGAAAGLLLYKPHFVVGFLILWLVWKEWRALVGFAIVALVWIGSSVLLQGIDPYLAYLELVPKLMQLYNLQGLGNFLEVTLYSFLTSILGQSNWQWIALLNQILAIVAGLGLMVYGWLHRNPTHLAEKTQAFSMAVLYPLIFSPHVLLHDSILLVVVFLSWSWTDKSKSLLYAAIIIYVSALLLPWFTFWSGISLLGIFPVFLGVRLVSQMIKAQKAARSR